MVNIVQWFPNKTSSQSSEVLQLYMMVGWKVHRLINIAVHKLLPSVLRCLDPISQKSHQQQIWHHHISFQPIFVLTILRISASESVREYYAWLIECHLQPSFVWAFRLRLKCRTDSSSPSAEIFPSGRTYQNKKRRVETLEVLGLFLVLLMYILYALLPSLNWSCVTSYKQGNLVRNWKIAIYKI